MLKIWLIFIAALYTLSWFAASHLIPAILVGIFFAFFFLSNSLALINWNLFLSISNNRERVKRIILSAPPWLIQLVYLILSFFFAAKGCFWLAGLVFCFVFTESIVQSRIQKLKNC